ncbi:MAG: 50S ribosomal protein L5 [Candidatus Heimdallarchaeota archaeon]|nr:50S ribosomal protein L5 [Candidatus Heimdallarchaeota archaeon]
MRRRGRAPVEEEREQVPLTDEEKEYVKEWQKHPMRKPKVAKVSVNFAVGASGPELEKARTMCKIITKQEPAEGRAKESVRGFAIRKHEPIAVFSTLRGELAHEFIKKSLWAVEDHMSAKKFDTFGNLSFGISDHLTLPNMKYDPQLGVHGFNTSIVLERNGHRIKWRRIRRQKIPKKHKITKKEGIAFFKHEYNLGVE